MIEYKGLLRDLISIPSLSGKEIELRNHISDWFKNRGLESFVQDENLIIHFEGKDRNRAFVFNSHMDTVTPGDKEWKHGPWNPTKENEKLIGLGSSDMKSGLAASMLLAQQIFSEGTPPVDLWFTYVVNEEVDGSGTESFTKWFGKEGFFDKYKDIAAIVTEPTGLVEVENGHRGNLFVRVVAEGESGHASRPDEIKGTLAVRKIIKFANALKQETVKWRKEYTNPQFKPSITVGEFTSIFAGTTAEEIIGEDGKKKFNTIPSSPNKFPSRCTAIFDVRTITEFHDKAQGKIEELGKRMGVSVSMEYPPGPAGFIEPSEKIVKISSSVLGKRKVTVSLASADLGFLTTKGIKGVIFGPGEKLQAHMVNEYCYPEQIPQAVNIYKAIMKAWAE